VSDRENIARLRAVNHALGDLAKEVVFVGGATVSLYATRPTGDTRPTDDVDILIELLHYPDYAAVEERLRAMGFVNDTESGVICRYIVQGIVVDVMPTSPGILGFSNRWYPEAFKHAIEATIGTGYIIRIFTAPYFLASKLEAFRDRGGSDGRMSTDFEDIVYVWNNRTTLWEELRAAPDNVRQYLQTEYTQLLEELYIDEWIGAHLDYAEQDRVNYILENLGRFIER
jgi:predicted nucleotidyltransferase